MFGISNRNLAKVGSVGLFLIGIYFSPAVAALETTELAGLVAAAVGVFIFGKTTGPNPQPNNEPTPNPINDLAPGIPAGAGQAAEAATNAADHGTTQSVQPAANNTAAAARNAAADSQSMIAKLQALSILANSEKKALEADVKRIQPFAPSASS